MSGAELYPSERYGWEPTLGVGVERHLDDGPERHILPRQPWASVWWDEATGLFTWAVWPPMRRVQLVVIEQRRHGVGKAAESGWLDRGTSDDYAKALDTAREALEARA